MKSNGLWFQALGRGKYGHTMKIYQIIKKVLFSTSIVEGDKLRHGMMFMKPSTLIMEKMTVGTVVQNPLACLVGSIWPYTVESWSIFAVFCLLICDDVFVWMYQCSVSVRTLITHLKSVFIENVNL